MIVAFGSGEDKKIAGKIIHYSDVIEKARQALKDTVAPDIGTVDDPEVPRCARGCDCQGIIWTARPPEDITVTTSFENNGVTYEAQTRGKKTISDGVGRCGTGFYEATITRFVVPQRDILLTVQRERFLTQIEIERIAEVLAEGTGEQT